jgi:uncharacterized protein
MAEKYAANSPADQQPPQTRKSPEKTFQDGLDCLRKSDSPCARLTLSRIPSQSPYAKILEGNIAASESDFDRTFWLLLPFATKSTQIKTLLIPQAYASLHASLAQAYENQGDVSRSLEQRTIAERYMSISDEVEVTELQANQQHIWRLIADLPQGQLIEMRGESYDTIIQGWIDLALANKSAEPAQAIAEWRKVYPDHPATANLARQLVEQGVAPKHAANTPPTPAAVSSTGINGKIALILPFQAAAFYPAADAIERGFGAAQTLSGGKTEIRIYATNGDKAAISGIYQKAIGEGARYVVGPLTRDEVTALGGTQLKVPTLALNQPESPSTESNLYTLGLSLDAEAAQIARIARDYGMQTAMVVTTDNAISSRMAKAFSDAWISEGGQIISHISINEKTSLTDAKAQLSNPSPTDMIMLAANVEEARALRPLLNIATPTFGFSHIYAGINHEPLDQALAAVRFIDLPWLLDNENPLFSPYHAAAADLPQGEMQRWFAIGVDAYQVLQALSQQPRVPTVIHGLTGKITIDEKGRISREQALGRFGPDGVVLENPR